MSSEPKPDGKLLKYSKSTDFYLDTKKDFFDANDKLLQKAESQNRLYAAQPRRKECKLCRHVLPETCDFSSHGVGYVFCTECTHLNGRYEDTREFVEQLYISDDGVEYSQAYIDTNFHQRTQEIYLPKIDFLLESTGDEEVSVLDVGCGSGHFVYAAILRNLTATGIDVGKTMVDFGNRQILLLANKTPLLHTTEEGFCEHIANTSASVVSAVGVIEHLRDLTIFFDAFNRSKAKYLFYSVPMFALSTYVENIFEQVYPRQLSGGHTHLFTETSIGKMNSLLGAKAIAEWRFGTDIMDLYRSLLNSIRQKNASEKLVRYFADNCFPGIDAAQAVLDRSHFCDEIHCVVQKQQPASGQSGV